MLDFFGNEYYASLAYKRLDEKPPHHLTITTFIATNSANKI